MNRERKPEEGDIMAVRIPGSLALIVTICNGRSADGRVTVIWGDVVREVRPSDCYGFAAQRALHPSFGQFIGKSFPNEEAYLTETRKYMLPGAVEIPRRA